MKTQFFLIISLLALGSWDVFAQSSPSATGSESTPHSETTLPTRLPQPGEVYPLIAVIEEHPFLVLSEQNPKPKTQLSATPIHFPNNAALTVEWTQVQDLFSPSAADVAKQPAELSPANALVTVATFSSSGVYEFRVVVKDAAHQLCATRNVWVNVWDSHSHILVDGKPDPLCVYPNLNPPNVRSLSPDPGPFHHPRLYTTNEDWKEVSGRCTSGKVAAFAVEQLKKEETEGIDASESLFGKLTKELELYADSHYTSEAPDLTMGISPDVDDKGNKSWDKASHNLNDYEDKLKKSCFLAWLGGDPSKAHSEWDSSSQDRSRQLAKVLAALCHLQFTHSFDSESGTFHKDYPLYPKGLEELGNSYPNMTHLALAYDFIASWMTPEEALETRNFLFAISAGRTTGARTVFFASGIHNRLCRGPEQNGDFMNIEEEKVLSGLVIHGEEGTVPEKIRKAFTEIAQPQYDGFQRPEDFYPCDWVDYTYLNGARAQSGARPYPDAISWPFARKVEVDNLKRAQWWNDDWYVTPWGFELNHEAYYGFSAWGLWPTAVAYARQGAENQFVSANYYVTINHLLWNCYGAEGYKRIDEFTPNRAFYDHHDGGNDYRQNHLLIMKYMYPEDPAVDYYYSGDNTPNEEGKPGVRFNPFLDALFGLDSGVDSKPNIDLAEVAQKKGLPLTIVDPQEGIAVARSDWTEEAMELYFDEAWIHTGHMHAEKGNFSFFALGRPWSFAPGYHITESGYQSEVLIQDSQFASDPLEHGYVGEGPNIGIDNNPEFEKAYGHTFPTPPGHMFPAQESPDKTFLILSGENTTAYSYSFQPGQTETDLKLSSFLYPGIEEELVSRVPSVKDSLNSVLHLTPHYNPVKYAYRSILFVRGNHPYVLVLDDIHKDDTPHNYRWQMNCSVIFGGPGNIMVDKDNHGVHSDLEMMPEAKPTEAVLYHSPIDDAPADNPTASGLPRLLVRDLSLVNGTAETPVMELNKKDLGDKKEAIHRAFLYKNGVTDPRFTVLLFPYKTGEPLPLTTWNKDHTVLSIDRGNRQIDEITFDRTNPDGRTRITSTVRKS